jgi:hypothetical protein
MASKDAARETQTLTGERKSVPRDRDQSAISPERAHDKADEAELAETTDADPPALGEGLTARDNFEDEPEAKDSPSSSKPKQ